MSTPESSSPPQTAPGRSSRRPATDAPPLMTGSTGRTRIEWPDAARGIAIILVVVHHSVLYSLQADIAHPVWGPLTEVLRTMRMPLFFLAAGLFAGKWARATWPDLVQNKLLLFAWVFAIWVGLRWAWFNIVPGQTVEDGLQTLFFRFVVPSGGWFIFVLAIFFAIAKATARVPIVVQLAVAAAVSVVSLSEIVYVGNQAWDGILSFYVFFLLGMHGRNRIIPAVQRLRWMPAVAIVIGGLGIVAVAGRLGLNDYFGVDFVLRLLGLSAGLALAKLLSGWSWLRALGRNTLPIYMSHSLWIVGIIAVIVRFGPAQPALPVALVMPLAVAVPSLLIALAIGVIAPKVGLRWLFDSPRWLSRAVHGVVSVPFRTLPRSKRVGLIALAGAVAASLAAGGGVAVAATADRLTPSSTPVAAIDRAGLGRALSTDPNAAAFISVLDNSSRYAMTVWFPETFAGQNTSSSLDFGGTTAVEIRPAASEALALATSLGTGTFSAESVGARREETLAVASALISSLAGSHWSNSVWGGWSGPDSWQGAHWAEMTGSAAWLIWDDLSDETRADVQNMIEKEADRFIGVAPEYWETPSSSSSDGDTKAEEIAWNATILQLSMAMLPTHPNEPAWAEANTRMLLASFARPSDVDDSTLYSGRPVSEWVEGWNINEDGTLVNHGILHPEYMATVNFKLKAVTTASLASTDVDPAAFHNTDLVYDALQSLPFDDDEFDSPGGTIYVPGSDTVYYPEGADRGLDRRMNFANLDLMESLYSPDRALAADASEWAALHVGRVAEMQARFTDGRTYAEGDDDTYYARESWVARYAALSVLALYAAR